jgi:hypothetical protein
VFSYRSRRKALDRAYAGKASATQMADLALLVFAIVVVVLLRFRGGDHVSFLTGLLVGMTLIQVYFHQFSVPLSDDEAPGTSFLADQDHVLRHSGEAKPTLEGVGRDCVLARVVALRSRSAVRAAAVSEKLVSSKDGG